MEMKKLHRIINIIIFNKIIGSVISIFLVTPVLSQIMTIHHPELQFLFEDSLLQQPNYHSVFKPLEVSTESFRERFQGSKDHFIYSYPNEINALSKIQINPIIDATGTLDDSEHHLLYRFGQGIFISGKLNQNIRFEASSELIEQGFPSKYMYSIDSLRLIPGHNHVLHGMYPNVQYTSINGYISWYPSRHLSIKAGNDKQFLGDGDRSLLLSEYAASYPFVQLNLNLWKIRYTYELMFLQDLVPGDGSERFDKYMVNHLLSYNVTKNFNLYAFETVIWRSRDSTFHRGLDVNYLNPFLVFYPVDWSIGSPDNKLLGFGSRWQIHKHIQLYGQILIDDLSTIYIEKYGWGWYGNKHAIQGGFKIYGNSASHRSLFQMEYNITRPYTYSHENSLDNYGYLNRPLAHPYGANFKEILAVYRLSFSKWWILNSRVVWTRFGADPPGKDYGSDIYLSDQLNRGISGNFVGQGILTDNFVQQLDVSRMLVPSWRLSAGLNISNQIQIVHINNSKTTYSPIIELGLRTLLYE